MFLSVSYSHATGADQLRRSPSDSCFQRNPRGLVLWRQPNLVAAFHSLLVSALVAAPRSCRRCRPEGGWNLRDAISARH